MDFKGIVDVVLKILRFLGAIVFLALFLYIRFKPTNRPKDLGDGGIQKLFPDDR